MLTFKAEVLKSKQKSDGSYNVKIRMTYKREVKRIPTNIFVRKDDLTKSFKIKKPQFIKEADALVRQYQEICATLPLESSNYTLNDIWEYIQAAIQKDSSIDFIRFSQNWIHFEKSCLLLNFEALINKGSCMLPACVGLYITA